MDGWVGGWMVGWVDGWMGGWMGGWNGWMGWCTEGAWYLSHHGSRLRPRTYSRYHKKGLEVILYMAHCKYVASECM